MNLPFLLYLFNFEYLALKMSAPFYPCLHWSAQLFALPRIEMCFVLKLAVKKRSG
jgi:hypothetical protein